MISGMPAWLQGLMLIILGCFYTKYIIKIKSRFLEKIGAFAFSFLIFGVSLLTFLTYTSITSVTWMNLLKILIIIWFVWTVIGIVIKYSLKKS